ncbi:MAG TPA: serine/threonine-protein kinase [Acidimicrobiales bacterium]|nr:serine/threonine-protein kinase [Acidimicrobiales bacterium]
MYEPVRTLARSPQSVVELARAADGSLVALKRVPVEGLDSERATIARRLRREAEVLTDLRVEGVVPLIEVLGDGDDVVLVMPYLEGGSLADRVAAGPMPPAEVHRLAADLLPALARLHRAGVLHRDIKPSNVLYDAAGRAHLSDFGIAARADLTAGLTPAGVVVGTPSFIAPERARGEPARPASDVYSLGATLRYAASGMPPHGVGDLATIARRAAAGQLEPLPGGVDAATRALLDGMCRLDPDERPTAAALAGGPDGTEPVPVVAPAPVAPPSAPARRPWLVATGAVLAGLALVGVGIGLGRLVFADADPSPPDLAADTDPGPGSTDADADTDAVAPGPTTTVCVDLPYQPCGAPEPAPNTDGTACLPDWFDHDGDPTNGCEAVDDGIDDAELVDVLRGTIIPDGDVDRVLAPVTDRFQLFCDGTLRLTLTAPEGITLELTAFDDGRSLGSVRAVAGEPGELVIVEPSCGSDDTTVLELVIRAVEGRSSGEWVLERSGSF